MPPTAPLDLEREAWADGCRRLAGLDEVGRGPLAGPVVAAAVVLRPEQCFQGAADSKTLSPERREALCARIRREAAACALGAASTREIERLNVLGATRLAMLRALDGLPCSPERILVDGRPLEDFPEHTALVGGDARSHTVACASIVAKVIRDRLMRLLDPRYPAYGWARNKGYGTPEHRRALDRHGPTPHHRRTFAPIAQPDFPFGEAGG